MDLVLVDTSVWVNFFKGMETSASLFLKNKLSNIIIATCPTILQETFQGILSDKELRNVNTYFNDLVRLEGDPFELAVEAAYLYRRLRKKGVTIRKPNDCLIAIYAIKHQAKLLYDDRDFYHIALNSELSLINFHE